MSNKTNTVDTIRQDGDHTKRDEILEMFLDEEFVPQAYVDILLSNVDTTNMNQVQALSSGLLSRLDFYTKTLTNQLETNIWNLEKLSETLPGTWSGSNSTENLTSIGEDKLIPTRTVGAGINGGVSKLEYYLDTLGSSVKSLETDLKKVELELNQNNDKNKDDNDVKGKQVIANLKDLKLIKTRLNEVLTIFNTLKDILDISTDKPDKTNAQQVYSIDDFKLSFNTLQDTIEQTLQKSLQEEDSKTINEEFLLKIEELVNLAPVFDGMDRFQTEYQKFVENIAQSSNDYLENKEIAQ